MNNDQQQKQQNQKPPKTDPIDFVADSQKALMQYKPRFGMLTLIIILALIIVSIVWAHFAVIDVVTTGHGKVVPTSLVHVIQNLEGGIVKKIDVKEGEMVRKNQVLANLDETRFLAQYNKNKVKLAILHAQIKRLTAEVNNLPEIEFSQKFDEENPEIVKFEINTFESRQSALKANIKTLKQNLKLAKQELQILMPLAEEGLVSKIERIRLEREVNSLKVQLMEKVENFRNSARQELNKAKSDHAELMQAIHASKDRYQRTELRSPIAGIVNKIYVTNVGQVVNPGEKIMDIVPLEKKLTINLSIKPSNIGFVHIGQKALVTFSAYEYARYGGIDATVTHISPDAIKAEDGQYFYEVKLVTDKNYLTSNEGNLRILPGMVISAKILTGKKSILSYILNPFTKVKEHALRE